MNKARGQKKDINRILKTIKLQQKASRYFQTLPQDQFNDNQIMHACKKIVYVSINSNNKKNQSKLDTKRHKYRYDRISTQNQAFSSLAARYRQSLDTKKETSFLRVSQKNQQLKQLNRNPYETKKKINSIRRQTSNSNKRRTLTQQASRPQSIKKNFHFNTINLHQTMNLSYVVQEAKNLAQNGSLMESQTLIQRILKQDPQNKDILYLSANNNFKQMNYLKCISMLNQLSQLDPLYNKHLYLMLSICYNNKGQKQQAMRKIDECISHFPQFYDAHFQKAKLFLKYQDTQNAIKSFKRALRLAKEPFQCCLKLGQCYQKQNLFQLALKLYDKITKQESYSGQQAQQRTLCILKKAQCQKKLHKYQAYIKSLQTYLKLIDGSTAVNLAKLNYEIAYGYYKLGDYSNTIMQLQQVFIQKNANESTAALILQTIINIKKRDFYEAYHCLLRKQHLQINQDEIQFYEKFCEGVLCLMKRKFQIGLQKLIELQSQVSEIFKDQFQAEIAAVYPMYLAYGYFCFGRTDKCAKIYKRLIQQNMPQLRIYRKGLQFNLCLCLGIQEYKHKKLTAARTHFEKSTQIYPNKSEGFLYLAIVLIHLFIKDYNQSFIKKAKVVLVTCINNLKELNNNYAASAFYVKAALSSFLGEWDDAINQIDESIERAEDNDAKSFYLRALILACCNNFKQAISQVSIAISLNSKEPSYYLLRSKCQQIEGDGNRAFMDLQEYISICPDDPQIHKYAGNLLFQNGAFQDALQAYENGDISNDPSNYDVFLTRAKTCFLLGNFSKCSQDMAAANKLRPNDPSISFDISVVNILNDFFHQSGSNLGNIQKSERAKQQLQNLAAVGQDIDYGRIFKKLQILMLLSLFLFYLGKYREAARQFKQTLTMKQQGFMSNQSDFDEQFKQKQFFIAQMHYNRAICFLMLSEYSAAIKSLQLCRLQQQSKTKIRLNQLINLLKCRKGESKSIQVFSQKNKMSKLLNQISINFGNNQIIKLKLSIPFPKVQPPEINPKFQIKILQQIDVQNMEKKPEAPWILREQNSIKFTQKIQQFSRLDINNSQLSKIEKTKKQKLGTQQQQQEESVYGNSFQSLSQLRYKLKLDDKTQNKLNKILNKQK